MSWNTPASARASAARSRDAGGVSRDAGGVSRDAGGSSSALGLSLSDLAVMGPGSCSSKEAPEPQGSVCGGGSGGGSGSSSSIGNGMVLVASTCPLSCMAHYGDVLVVGGEGGHVSAGKRTVVFGPKMNLEPQLILQFAFQLRGKCRVMLEWRAP